LGQRLTAGPSVESTLDVMFSASLFCSLMTSSATRASPSFSRELKREAYGRRDENSPAPTKEKVPPTQTAGGPISGAQENAPRKT